MVQLYVKHILAGTQEFEKVPPLWKEKVRAELQKIGYFDNNTESSN